RAARSTRTRWSRRPRAAARARPSPPRAAARAHRPRRAGDWRRRASLAPLEPAHDLLVFQRPGQLERLVEIDAGTQAHGLRVLLEGPPGPARSARPARRAPFRASLNEIPRSRATALTLAATSDSSLPLVPLMTPFHPHRFS